MIRTLDFWTTMAEQHGQAVALEDSSTQVTYAELMVAVNALAVALQSKDPAPGSRVALCAQQSLEYQVSMLAILAAGKILVPLSPNSSTDSLHQLLNDTLCSTIIVDEAGQKKINEIGRASCRARGCQYVWITVVAVSLKKKTKK